MKRRGELITKRKRLKKIKRPRVLKTFTKHETSEQATKPRRNLDSDLDNAFSFKWVVCLLTFNNSPESWFEWQGIGRQQNFYQQLGLSGNLWKLENINQTGPDLYHDRERMPSQHRGQREIIKKKKIHATWVIKSTHRMKAPEMRREREGEKFLISSVGWG